MAAVLAAAYACAAPAWGQPTNARRMDQAMQGLAIRNAGNVRSPAETGAVHEPFTEPITAAKIGAAIDDAVTFLRSRQQPDGRIGVGYGAEGGETALAALAMLASGADPASDDCLKKALAYLAKVDVDNTYVRGIRANVWEYALRKVPYDEGIRKALKADFDWLLKALGNKEAWRYTMGATDWDNSCTQYGVLGIWAAARAGLDPGKEFWQKMSKHFRTCQTSEGGWSYLGASGPTANMSTAGLASMFLVFDMLHSDRAYSAKEPGAFTSGEAAECLKSIARGIDWLAKCDSGKEGSYYLYGIERTAVAGGRKYIGAEDWFARGALHVLTSQDRTGAIRGEYQGVVSTSLCTLFLVYGGAPAAYQKLQFGAGEDWNLNPRDIANLTKHLWTAYERPLNWSCVSIAAPAAELEAPVLFLSGAKAARFSEEEMLKLRQYVLGGGTILAEPADGSPEFARSMEELLAQMFSPRDYPKVHFQALEANHAVYTVVKQEWKARPELLGASDGTRTFFFLSKGYVAADWQMNRTDSDAFKLAMNLLFYATDLGTLEGRFASILPNTSPAPERKGTSAVVARVKYACPKDAPYAWSAGEATWSALAPYFRHVTGAALREKPPVEPGKDDLSGIGLLHITGRGAMALTAAQREALKKYVEGGGTILADAWAGGPEFARTARAELEAVFGALAPLPDDDVLAAGRFAGGADLARDVGLKLRARVLVRQRDLPVRGPKLLVARVKGRPAVLFSEFDLSGALAGVRDFGALGYDRPSACRIATNILAYGIME
jgi:hypothetical protein